VDRDVEKVSAVTEKGTGGGHQKARRELRARVLKRFWERMVENGRHGQKSQRECAGFRAAPGERRWSDGMHPAEGCAWRTLDPALPAMEKSGFFRPSLWWPEISELLARITAAAALNYRRCVGKLSNQIASGQ
jgi:hypothetical protein